MSSPDDNSIQSLISLTLPGRSTARRGFVVAGQWTSFWEGFLALIAMSTGSPGARTQTFWSIYCDSGRVDAHRGPDEQQHDLVKDDLDFGIALIQLEDGQQEVAGGPHPTLRSARQVPNARSSSRELALSSTLCSSMTPMPTS